MFEDSSGNEMVVVQWFHKIDEVGIVLPHNYNRREIFSSLCFQDLSIECMDGLATVLSPAHFKKFLKEATHTRVEPFLCSKQFDNDDVKPFDVTQVKGYWKQDILRYLYGVSPSDDCVSCQQCADDRNTDWNVDDCVGIRPRKRYCQSKEDDIYMHYSGSRDSMDASCEAVQDLPGEKQELIFDSGDARHSQEWLGNRWINIKERHDFVNSILWVRKQDAGKFSDCNLVKTTICDGGQCAKDATGCSDCDVEQGNDRAKDVSLVPDLSKDDSLSLLKWKLYRKRKLVTATYVRKLNCSRNLMKSTAGSVTCQRFLIPASFKVDNVDCKHIGDPLFSSPVMPPLTSLVMTR